MARIVISGSSGFLASKLIPLLLRDGHEILCFSSGRSKFINDKSFNLPIIKEQDLENKIKDFKPDIFLNLQVSFYFNHNKETLVEMLEANVSQPLRVLDILVDGGLKHIITATSFTEFGDSDRFDPINLFAATKAAFTTLCTYYNKMRSVSLTDVIVYDTFGEGDKRKKILNIFKENMDADSVLDMSPGEQVIDLSHIDDIASAFCKLTNSIEQSKINGLRQTLFASTGNRFTLKELAKKFELITNSKLNINWGGREYRYGEVMLPVKLSDDKNICDLINIDSKIKNFVSK